jgi:Icc protein
VTAPLLRVFAVEDTAVQLTWRALPTRRACVAVGDRRVPLDVPAPAWLHHRRGWSRPLCDLPGGPGAVVVDGLTPDTTYPVRLLGAGADTTVVAEVRTLTPPPGRLLSRFATISDTHIGEQRFGALGSLVDVQPRSAGAEPYPLRCARAAITEAGAWGAELLVVKGDLTARARPGEFAVMDALLAGCGLPAVVQLGNHDKHHRTDIARWLPRSTVALPGGVVVRDLAGVRVVAGDSAVLEERDGALDATQLAALAAAAADAAGPAVVTLHHPPQRWPVPLVYPPGLRRPDSRALTSALRRANPASVVLAGHTHRNRTYRVDGMLVAEVGSTKDHPGVWAGYAVHEGGIRQVVRRIARPDVIAWTEATAAAVGGVWGRWSPGRLDDRCWSHAWPSR